MVTTKSTQIERVISQGDTNKFSGKTTAKDFRSYMEHRIGVHVKKGNEEYRQYDMEILRAYNYFNPRKEAEVKVDSWKGESSFELIKGLDKLTIIKFQRKQKGDEPSEVRTEISKEELEGLIKSIRRISIITEVMETKDLAFEYCNLMNYNNILNGEFWKNFFSNRKLHNKFTLMLGALDKLGLVEYKGGKTRLLNKDLSIQLVLL
jgi:hypothetical protein